MPVGLEVTGPETISPGLLGLFASWVASFVDASWHRGWMSEGPMPEGSMLGGRMDSIDLQVCQGLESIPAHDFLESIPN